MPKRRHPDDLDRINRKIKKLERKLKRVRRRKCDSDDTDDTCSHGSTPTDFLIDAPGTHLPIHFCAIYDKQLAVKLFCLPGACAG